MPNTCGCLNFHLSVNKETATGGAVSVIRDSFSNNSGSCRPTRWAGGYKSTPFPFGQNFFLFWGKPLLFYAFNIGKSVQTSNESDTCTCLPRFDLSVQSIWLIDKKTFTQIAHPAYVTQIQHPFGSINSLVWMAESRFPIFSTWLSIWHQVWSNWWVWVFLQQTLIGSRSSLKKVSWKTQREQNNLDKLFFKVVRIK